MDQSETTMGSEDSDSLDEIGVQADGTGAFDIFNKFFMIHYIILVFFNLNFYLFQKLMNWLVKLGRKGKNNIEIIRSVFDTTANLTTLCTTGSVVAVLVDLFCLTVNMFELF